MERVAPESGKRGHLSRRSILTGAAAGAGTLLVSGSAVARVAAASEQELTQSSRGRAPWTAYQGAEREAPVWATAQRGGPFGDEDGRVDEAKLSPLLKHHDLISWSPPRIPSQREDANHFELMNNVRATSGAWARDISRQWISDLVAVHTGTKHKVIGVMMDNEINTAGRTGRTKRWTESVGLPFPHPRSDFGDGVTDNSRDFIGYWVEYFLAPCVEGANQANAEVAPELRIPVLLGSIANIRQPAARDRFLPALLEYEIEGAYAPTLAGMRVKDIIDYVAIHYLLTVEEIYGYVGDDGVPLPYGYRDALDDLHNRWIGNGSIKGIWHTEEGGNQAQKADRHASLGLRVFGRLTSWALDRDAAPEQIRVSGYYYGPPGGWPDYQPRKETSWDFGLSTVHDFIGESSLINRSNSLSVDADDPVEAYAFETDGHTRRVVLVSPQTSPKHQGPTHVSSITIDANGWSADGAAVEATLHHFKSDEQGYNTFPVNVTGGPADGGRYRINLPEPIALNPSQQTLMVHLRHPGEPSHH